MFKDFKRQVKSNFDKLAKADHLFYAEVDREAVWGAYINSFQDQNTKQTHVCNACRSFIRQYSGIVGVVGNKVVSIWDNITDVEPHYVAAAKNLSEYIHSLPITDVFYSETTKCGTDRNNDPKNGCVWEHFYIEVPAKMVKQHRIDSIRGEKRTKKQVLERALNELTIESVEVVLELIAQGSLYRGTDHKAMVESFNKVQIEYNALPADEKQGFLWVKSTILHDSVCGIRNTAIGTLLTNLSEGMEVDSAVTAYERVVAPSNYKRPVKIATAKQYEAAKATLIEHNLLSALERRYATETDLPIDAVLFKDGGGNLTDIFDDLKRDVPVTVKSLSKVEEITIERFVNEVLPKSKSVELLLENGHLPNFVSVIAPKYGDSGRLMKWDNDFSWSYTGNVTDSIKERVKAAGGNVNGVLRVSLSWSNHDDLDLHVVEPDKNRIYFHSKVSKSSGQLDVDMNAGFGRTRTPVENTVWTDRNKMLEGDYKVLVNNYTLREKQDAGYAIQIECDGKVYDYSFDRSPSHGNTHEVVVFNWTKANGLVINGSPTEKIVEREKWGLKTNRFHKVKVITLSPNCWNGGEAFKHYFFMLENCLSDEDSRPFYNEFLRQELNEFRHAMEMVGAKLKVEKSQNQLSGIGFSDTQRNHVYVKVQGTLTRTLKINF